MTKLTQTGVTHLLLVLGFISMFAIAGVAYMVATSAATQSGTIQIDARQRVGIPANNQGETYATRKSGAHVSVYASQASRCNGKKINGGASFGAARTLKCTPGLYRISLVNKDEFEGLDSKKQSQFYQETVNVELEAGEKVKIHLGAEGGSRQRPN